MEAKPTAVGVTHRYVNNQPRIVVAFFLDNPDIQVTEDDSGRPIVVAAFEPEAAYVTLAKKIKESREQLKRMEGSTDYVTPYMSLATLCQNILHEKDDVLSIVRLVDIFQFASEGDLPPDHRMALLVKGLLQFRGGPERFAINIFIYGHDSEQLVSATADVILNGGSHSYSVQIELAVPIRGEGTYRLDVFRGNEQLATLPFQVRRAPHQPTPSTQS